MKMIITISLIFAITNSIYSQHSPFADFTPSQNSYIDYGRGLNLNCLTSLSSGNKMTITCWVKWTDKNATGVGSWANLLTLADSINSGDNGVFWVQHNSDNSKFEFAIYTNSRDYIYSTTTPQNGQWYFLALVYDGSLPNTNMELYVNGNLESNLNKTGNIRNFPTASRLNMGRWANPSGNYRHFNGKMDEVSIWQIALTPAQIQSMMNNSESVTGVNYDAVGLMDYWNFDNYTANDLTSCRNNGVIGSDVSLPVTLINLMAENVNGKVNVKWSTSAEINNDYFHVERSLNGKDFEMVGKINGSGNSNLLNEYQFTDYNPLTGVSYYRLRQVDFDGKVHYSPVISVNVVSNSDFSVSLYPNPTQGRNIFIKSNDINLEKFEVKIFDMAGREVYKTNTNNGLIEISSDSFKNGVFFVQAQTNENTSVMKLVKE